MRPMKTLTSLLFVATALYASSTSTSASYCEWVMQQCEGVESGEFSCDSSTDCELVLSCVEELCYPNAIQWQCTEDMTGVFGSWSC